MPKTKKLKFLLHSILLHSIRTSLELFLLHVKSDNTDALMQ